MWHRPGQNAMYLPVLVINIHLYARTGRPMSTFETLQISLPRPFGVNQ